MYEWGFMECMTKTYQDCTPYNWPVKRIAPYPSTGLLHRARIWRGILWAYRQAGGDWNNQTSSVQVGQFYFAAPKDSGTLRFRVDYHRLDTVNIPEPYLLLRIDDCNDIFNKIKVFIALDGAWRCLKIPIRDEGKDRTPFTAQPGIYCYKLMPFDLQIAPGLVQFAPNKIFFGVRGNISLFYINFLITFRTIYVKKSEKLMKCLHCSARLNWCINYPNVTFSKIFDVMITYSFLVD